MAIHLSELQNYYSQPRDQKSNIKNYLTSTYLNKVMAAMWQSDEHIACMTTGNFVAIKQHITSITTCSLVKLDKNITRITMGNLVTL